MKYEFPVTSNPNPKKKPESKGLRDFYFKTSYKNNFIRKYGIKHCPVCRNDT